MIGTLGRTIFWKSYFKVYDHLCEAKPYQQMIRRGVELLAPKRDERFLDAGSGTGNSTFSLWMRTSGAFGGSVTGIDTSQFGLQASKNKFPEAEYPGLKFLFGDIDKPLQFEAGSMNGVFANNSMYLARDPMLTLCEIHRVLVPGGRFVMSTPKSNASPLAIFFEDARMRFYENLMAHSKIVANTITTLQVARNLFYFSLFLPFQIALKMGAGGASNFIGENEWRIKIDDLADRGYRFDIVAVESTYAGQNTLFAMEKR